MENKFLLRHKDLILVLVLYSILSVLLLNFYRYVITADGISYIGIARNYLTLNLSDTINGYWAPLFSWLLIPFLLFNKTAVYALFSAKILSLIVGFFTIIGVERLSRKIGIEKVFRVALLFSMIPIVLSFALTFVTPDLLIACLLVFYLAVIFDPKYSDKLSNGVFCGVIGAAAYLSKSYALPFFVVHFVFFNLIYYSKSSSRDKKKNILKNFILGISIFLLISGVWIGAISDKYGELTIGTSGEYNQALIGPESQGHPMYYQGLLKPSNKNAISVWEDPSNLKMEKWSPFKSMSYFKHQITIMGENVVSTISYLEYFSLLSLLIILFSLFFIFKSSFKDSRDKLMYLLITLILYCGGYALILVEMRYLYLICILLFLMAFYMLNISCKQKIINIKMRNVLLILLIFSFIIMPVINLIQSVNMSKGFYDLSQNLGENYGVHGNIASNDEWEETIYVSYYLNAQYYGMPKNITNSNGLQNELENSNINYYFVWDGQDNLNLKDYKEITYGNIQRLKIYSRI